MSDDTKIKTANIDLTLSNLSLDTTEVDEYTSAGSQKSKFHHQSPEFVNANDEVLYATLKTIAGGMTRCEVVEVTGIARSTTFDCLQRLILRGLVKRSPQHEGTVGRPKKYFESCFPSQVTT